jgi:hypothetical protein
METKQFPSLISRETGHHVVLTAQEVGASDISALNRERRRTLD